MTTTLGLTLLLIAILLAFVLDIVLTWRLRRYFTPRDNSGGDAVHKVYLFGGFSSLLTRLKSRRATPAPLAISPATSPAAGEDGSEITVLDALKGGLRGLFGTIGTEEGWVLRLSTINEGRWRLIEWAVVIAAVVAFCGGFLRFAVNDALPGNEAEVFQTLDWTLVNSLSHYGQFPVWNPYLETGLPYLGDPMAHVFNPLVTIPVLLYGVTTGFKLGLLLSFLAAALGMLRLGSALGMGRAARLWVALLYVFAGQPAARFFQGQYLFVLGFAWIPWCIGSLYLLYKTRRRFHIATSAIALALIYFSGNAYYAFYMLVAVGLMALVLLPRLKDGSGSLRSRLGVDTRFLANLLLTTVLTLGIVAVQFMPMVEFWPRLSKSSDLTGSQTPQQVFWDYASKSTTRPDLAGSSSPASREEYYAYIGLWPILALALVPLAFWKRERRLILLLLLLLGFTFIWIDVQNLPWQTLFLQSDLFHQFRQLLRILVYGSFAIILLAGLSLDTLWKMLKPTTSATAQAGRDRMGYYLSLAGTIALALSLLVTAANVFDANQPILQTRTADRGPYAAMGWLRQTDPSVYHIRINPSNTYHDAVVSNNLFFIDAWYHFADIRRIDGQINQRPVEGRANYVVQRVSDPPPEDPHEIVQQVDDFVIYRMTDSLPFAFSASRSALAENPVKLRAQDVTAVPLYLDGPNRMEVITSGNSGDVLTVMTTQYPGWVLRVDGKPQPVLNVGGYLAASIKPGVHQYVFSFQPLSFPVGLATSLLCCLLAVFLLASDTQIDWQARWRRFPSAWEAWRSSLERFRTGLQAQRNLSKLSGVLAQALTLEGVLFGLALAVYAFTRLYALNRFPVYFFADEAAQALYAKDLISSGFKDAHGAWFPVYVLAANSRWTPLLPMYIHAFTLTVFGNSIFVTRGTSAVISILSAVSVSLILKEVFKVRYWWTGALILAITPTWFLHSRTAFETVMTTSFYACFLLFYLLYRNRSPRFLYPAVIFAAATFYTYSNGQLIAASAAGLLFLSDIRYHLRNWRTILKAALLVAILAWPLINFRLHQPQAIYEHLRMIDSYLFHPIPLTEKIATFIKTYAYGLSPAYWFIPNSQDIVRHRMDDMGHIFIWEAPLIIVGLAVCLWNFRKSSYRAILLAVLATPVGASLAEIGITRVLSFVVPASLLAALGLDWLLERFKNRFFYAVFSLAAFAALAGGSLALLRTALVDGPFWFKDYGLYGIQYGAEQLFVDTIPDLLERSPQSNIMVTSSWANGADEFVRYFLTPEQQKHIQMEDVEGYLFKRLPLNPDDFFIMTDSEYQKAVSSSKFKYVKLDRLIPYPDGTPGFYITQLDYADNADEIFAAEKEERRKLLETDMLVDGQMVHLSYSRIDMGEPKYMFDGDHFTVMRGLEANPFILEMAFSEPRSLSGLAIDNGMSDMQLTIQLFTEGSTQPLTYQITRDSASNDPNYSIQFGSVVQKVSKIHLEFLNKAAGETANIHIFELKLLP
jgi:hypothetical protein